MSPVFLSLQLSSGTPSDYKGLVLNASVEVQFVLAVLLVLSVLSWTIMFLKSREFRRVRAASVAFTAEFERVSRLEQAISLSRRSPNSPHTRIFMRALRFVPGLRLAAVDPIAAVLGQEGDADVRVESQQSLSESQVNALRYVLDSETMSERDKLARFVAWLATIGSVSPLLGLFGTVLGVINAFLGIATTGNANLTAVAPGVAEALIATAAALATAIPAVFGYNHFANQLNELEGEMEGFGSEVIALLVKEGKL